MSRLLFESRAAVLACEAQQALIEKEIELEKLKQQRKPLTDEQMADFLGCRYHTMSQSDLEFFRLGEAAHGVTGEQK